MTTSEAYWDNKTPSAPGYARSSLSGATLFRAPCPRATRRGLRLPSLYSNSRRPLSPAKRRRLHGASGAAARPVCSWGEPQPYSFGNFAVSSGPLMDACKFPESSSICPEAWGGGASCASNGAAA